MRVRRMDADREGVRCTLSAAGVGVGPVTLTASPEAAGRASESSLETVRDTGDERFCSLRGVVLVVLVEMEVEEGGVRGVMTRLRFERECRNGLRGGVVVVVEKADGGGGGTGTGTGGSKEAG